MILRPETTTPRIRNGQEKRGSRKANSRGWLELGLRLSTIEHFSRSKYDWKKKVEDSEYGRTYVNVRIGEH